MKSIIKKIVFASLFTVSGMALSQYSENEIAYANNNYDNGDQYQYYYDDYNYPDEYYYEYPSDYYTNGFYKGYYNDYRNAIIGINWDRFFIEFRLSPVQIREIRILNARFPNYGQWQKYYRYNPDRWYYDRFIALERILGPRIYVVFYQRYYHNYNPIVYFQNYRVKNYRPSVYITPRYRNVDVRTFKNENFRNGNFRNERDKNIDNVRENNGFRGGMQNNGKGFKRDDDRPKNFGNENNQRGGGFRNDVPKNEERMRNEDRGFRGQKNPGENKERGNNGRRFR